MMCPAGIEAPAFRAVFRARFHIVIEEYVIIRGKTVEHSWSNGKNLLIEAVVAMSIDFGVRDLLEEIPIQANTQLTWSYLIGDGKVSVDGSSCLEALQSGDKGWGIILLIDEKMDSGAGGPF